MAEAKDDVNLSSESKQEITTRQEVLQKVMDFAMSDDFEAAFEDFAAIHKTTFLKALIMDEGAEHPLEWHDVYLEYLHTFEGKIERFIARIGFEITDFYEECKLILEGDDVWGETRFFLEALLATAEYETFVRLMKNEMERFRVELDIEHTNESTDNYTVGVSPKSSPKNSSVPNSPPVFGPRLDSKGYAVDDDTDSKSGAVACEDSK